MIHSRVLLAVLAAAMLPISAPAQSAPHPPSLVPAARAVAPGDTIPVAIRLLTARRQ